MARTYKERSDAFGGGHGANAFWAVRYCCSMQCGDGRFDNCADDGPVATPGNVDSDTHTSAALVATSVDGGSGSGVSHGDGGGDKGSDDSPAFCTVDTVASAEDGSTDIVISAGDDGSSGDTDGVDGIRVCCSCCRKKESCNDRQA